MIFDIQRFCTHDGPGIRTVVFLKGCPLDCVWCHNPESKRFERQLFYNESLCIACGVCVDACPQGAHAIHEGVHVFDRSRCRVCLRCAEVCVSKALEAAGREVTVEEVMAEVEKDRVFYDESGGGLTLSGGEPMAQFEFTRELLTAARTDRMHTCVETCGFGPTERFLELVPLVDIWLWDVKDTDEERHSAYTHMSLAPIMENLERVDRAGGQTLLRCLLISGVNLLESHLDSVALLSRKLKNCQGVELLPYHPYGSSKHSRLGMAAEHDPTWVPTSGQMSEARAYLKGKWGIDADAA